MNHNKPRILVIDDMSSDIELITEILKKKNYRIASAKNGKTAITKAKAHKFDLILLDVILPDMDGYEICKHLKKFPSTKDIPIIFITVKTDHKSLLRGFEAGAVDYITKPFNELELLARVNTHLELKFSREELKKAKEDAERSDKLKSAFLSNMSHEIRTPINAIIGFSELLLLHDITDEQNKEYIDIIINNGNVLIELIDDIIEISKIEAGEIKIEETDCPVNKILSELFITFNNEKNKLGKKDITIKVNKANDSPDFSIISDPLRFRQIFSNLIGNALKFTKTGYIEFGYTFIKDDEIDKENNFIRFYVKDTGIGIPKDKHKIIFKRFIQIDYSNTRKYQGTGLGLSISKSLVKLLGGDIWVDSIEGKGSIFYFTLPYKPAKSVAEYVEIQDTHKDNYDWENKTILIVEDISTVNLFLKKVLQRTKAETISAENGLEAVKLFKEKKQEIDLILMDLQMPVMDGFMATTKIRQLDKKVPIIAQTVLTMKEERNKASEAGCNDYITKPIKINELLVLISKYIDK
jgi:signal transduction histidine kinase